MTEFGKQVNTKFDGEITHFLGISFNCKRHDGPERHVSIHLSQEEFIDTLLVKAGLDDPDSGTCPTPYRYRSGYPIDKIPKKSYDSATQARITLKMQQLTGSLQWLSTSTIPDIATAVNILSRYNHCATSGHLDACKRVIRYLKGTKRLGITFHSKVKFPLDPNTMTPFTDANWGSARPIQTKTQGYLQNPFSIRLPPVVDAWPSSLGIQATNHNS